MKAAGDSSGAGSKPLPTGDNCSSAYGGTTTSAHYLLIATCTLISLVDGFDTQSVAFAAPSFAQEFGLLSRDLGVVFSLGLFGGLCGAPLTVFFEARLGRRLFLTLCLLWFSAGSAATGLVGSGDALKVVRFLSGIGLGMAIPYLIATMTDSIPRRIRARALALVTCAIPGGALLAGFTAAAVVEPWGWRSVFLIGFLMPLLLIPAALSVSPKSVAPLDPPAATHAPGAASTPVQRFRGAFLEGGLPLLLLLAANFISMLLAFSLMNWTPSFLVMSGVDQSTASVAGGLLNGGAMIAILLLGYLLDRLEASPLAVASFTMAAVLLFLMGILSGGPTLTLVVTFLAGFFTIGSQITINYLLAHSVQSSLRVAVISIAMVVSRSGAATGPLVVGLLVQDGWAFAALLTAGAAITVIIAALVLAAKRASRLRQQNAPA